MIKTPLSTVIGGAFWTPRATVIGGGALSFEKLIAKLFANNEQGFFYDPNDLSTMFQDAAGTVPVTGSGQPVGLILDKSKGVPVARKNLASWTQEFQKGFWVKYGATVQADVIQAPDGTLTADKLVSNESTGSHIIYTNLPTGMQFAISIYAKAAEYTQLVLSNQDVSHVVYDLSNGTIVSQVGATGTITAVGGGWYRCTWSGIFTQQILRIGLALGGERSFTGTSGNGIYIWGVQCERGAVATSYQKVDSPYGGWVAGNHAYQTTSASRPILRKNAVTGAYYLEFDGWDDFLRTASIGFTGTDKMSLFAGVRNLSDEGQIIAELSEISNFNDGAFYLTSGNDLVIGYSSMARGTALISPSQIAGSFTHLAPDTAVLSVKHDISGDLSGIRRNGVAGTDGTGDKGSGNFGNYPLYIGRRGGTSLPFNGHIYGLIGVGKLTTDYETLTIEKELAKRTGVTLSV